MFTGATRVHILQLLGPKRNKSENMMCVWSSDLVNITLFACSHVWITFLYATYCGKFFRFIAFIELIKLNRAYEYYGARCLSKQWHFDHHDVFSWEVQFQNLGGKFIR